MTGWQREVTYYIHPARGDMIAMLHPHICNVSTISICGDIPTTHVAGRPVPYALNRQLAFHYASGYCTHLIWIWRRKLCVQQLTDLMLIAPAGQREICAGHQQITVVRPGLPNLENGFGELLHYYMPVAITDLFRLRL